MTERGHNPCATCGACCRSYIVPVCGYDVWLISTRQRLSPEEFLLVGPQENPRADGFRLDRDGPTYGLALDKRRPLRVTQPCVFLIRLGGGNDRCGIYAERPVVCRGYPMSIWKDVVAQRGDALCPSGSWSEADIGMPSWREALQALRMHFDIYYEVVARWNARVASQPPTAQFELPEYLSYLLNVYDRLAALDDDMGAPAVARVQADWRRVPARATGPSSAAYWSDDIPWLHHFGRARQIIDGFYPEIPPQPFQISVAEPNDSEHAPVSTSR